MWNRRLTLVCAGLVLAWMLGWTCPASAQEQTDAFTGTWHVMLTPDSATLQNGGKAFNDALVFQNAELLTENFAYLGFNAGVYAVPGDAPQKFTASMSSGTKGKLDWSGNVDNNVLRGTLVWTKSDGVVWTFTFVTQQ